jgi:hypothetical protein
MKTKIVAALLALTFAAGIGFPAAAEEGATMIVAPAAQSRAGAPAPSVQSADVQFVTVTGIEFQTMTEQEMGDTRGAKYERTSPVHWLVPAMWLYVATYNVAHAAL